MATLQLTPKLLGIVDNILNSNDQSIFTAENIASIVQDRANNEIKLSNLKLLKMHLQATENSSTLHELFQGCKLRFPRFEIKPKEQSFEQQQRRQYLQLRQESREYNKMIYGTEHNPHLEKLMGGNQYASAQNQMTICVNMVVSVLATFGICYYVGTQYSSDESTCMMFGLAGAIGIMIVEMGLFIIRAIQMEEVYERAPTADKEIEVLRKSGSLVTADVPLDYSARNNGLNLSENMPPPGYAPTKHKSIHEIATLEDDDDDACPSILNN